MKIKLTVAMLIIVLTHLKANATTTGCLWDLNTYIYTTPYSGSCPTGNCYLSPHAYYYVNKNCLSITKTPCNIYYEVNGQTYNGVIATHEGTAADVGGAVCNTDLDGYDAILLGFVSVTSVAFLYKYNRASAPKN